MAQSSVESVEVGAVPGARLQVRASGDRGRNRMGWLDARHSFSFGGYRDPRWMGFGPLWVLNEDRVAPRSGFPQHPHRNAEILTWVVEGQLSHRDTMGSRGTIGPGEMQYMSAGSGVYHSEMNEGDEPTHLLQIWLAPNVEDAPPRYADRAVGEARHNRLCLLASRDGSAGSVHIRADVDVHASKLDADRMLTHVVPLDRGIWLQLISGVLEVGGVRLTPGDAGYATRGGLLEIRAHDAADFLLFELG